MKEHLLRYLQEARDALLWKLEGLSDYDLRRPLTPTGTNLLGVVKHTALTEAGYLGQVFGRPIDDPLPGLEPDAEPNADMWATLDETHEVVAAFYRRVWQHSDATVAALPLDAQGRVPWWRSDTVTLHQILLHVIAETHRHAGHVDIVRELIDASAGVRPGNTNLPSDDAAYWQDYRERLQKLAEQTR